MKFNIIYLLPLLIAFSHARPPVISSEKRRDGTSGSYKEPINDNNDVDDQDLSDPWETPFQELVRITPNCSRKIPEFDKTVWKAEVEWQKCMDSINPHIPILENGNENGEDEKVNASVFHEIDEKVYMTICGNTTAFKSCWFGIIAALNECEPGAGDVSGNLYFALYDDTCRSGGRITYENRRKAEAQGRLCERDYVTNECRSNRHLRNHVDFYDTCKRFQSNVACDLSSIDPNCPNMVDKNSHPDIFQRVGPLLQCTQINADSSSGASYASLPLLVLYNFIIILAK